MVPKLKKTSSMIWFGPTPEGCVAVWCQTTSFITGVNQWHQPVNSSCNLCWGNSSSSFFGSSGALDLTWIIHKSFWSVEQSNTDFMLITHSNKLGDGLLRHIRLLCDYCYYTHQSLWGEFDMLHSPMIGIMELISTCYSVQLVRLPLHPQSSPPSSSSMYDNKHCCSGFPHLLVHSFIPYSYFCGHVCRQENAHVSCAAAHSAASSV